MILSSIFVLSPIILVLVEEKFKEFKEETADRLNESHVRPIDMNSLAAPTFGPGSSKSIEKNCHIKAASEDHMNLKGDLGKETARTVKFVQKEEEGEIVEQKEGGCLSKLF